MKDDNFVHLKSVIESQTRLILRPLASHGYSAILGHDSQNDKARRKWLAYIKKSISKLNSSRKHYLRSLFTQQAMTHITFQLLETEKTLSKIHQRQTDEDITISYYKQYRVMSYSKITNRCQILLESGKLQSTKSQKLRESLERYRKARAKSLFLKKIITVFNNKLNSENLDSRLLTPSSELSNRAFDTLSLGVRVSAKTAVNKQKLLKGLSEN